MTLTHRRRDQRAESAGEARHRGKGASESPGRGTPTCRSASTSGSGRPSFGRDVRCPSRQRRAPNTWSPSMPYGRYVRPYGVPMASPSRRNGHHACGGPARKMPCSRLPGGPGCRSATGAEHAGPQTSTGRPRRTL